MQDPKSMQFDEATYLACNPDVQRAVASGQFSSGFDHFVKFGRNESRRGVSVDPTARDGSVARPPEHLRFRVHGGRDLEGYLRLGQIISHDLDKLIEDRQISVATDAKVLDFGCGPGRVATWMRQSHPQWKIHGTDIDDEAIAWARANLPDVAEFACNLPMPPLPYEDATFDFVYSISIFTHLPEDMQNAWLQELARVTRPGGWLALTTHAETLLPPGFDMARSGFFYAVGPGTQGLPGFYQTSFQTSEFIERNWSKFFKIEKIIPRGLASHQDMVVCRR